jgi:hypothetical protein
VSRFLFTFKSFVAESLNLTVKWANRFHQTELRFSISDDVNALAFVATVSHRLELFVCCFATIAENLVSG